jgi:hypothetical protein
VGQHHPAANTDAVTHTIAHSHSVADGVAFSHRFAFAESIARRLTFAHLCLPAPIAEPFFFAANADTVTEPERITTC